MYIGVYVHTSKRLSENLNVVSVVLYMAGLRVKGRNC